MKTIKGGKDTMNKLEDFIFPTQEKLFKLLQKMFPGKKTVKAGKYILIHGEAPIMLLAHMDTVHKEPVKTICKSNGGNVLMSPQGIGGDDRCGVYALVKTYRASPVKPWLLFTCDEEIGGKGADEFADDYIKNRFPRAMEDIRFLVEIDRKGSKDAVYYDCDNVEFEEYISSFGFETEYGSYTDICDIAPVMGVAAVNLSSGYYNAHTQHEYIVRPELEATIRKVIKIVANAADAPQFEYIELPRQRLYNSSLYGQFKWSDVADGGSAPAMDIPEQYLFLYEDLVDVYDQEYVDEFIKEFGVEELYGLYEETFGPFYELEDKNIS